MKDEVAAAVVFLTRVVRQNNCLDKAKLDVFSSQLTTALVDKFNNHWYEEYPNKGQAYRCIRVTEAEATDPVLARVAAQCGLRGCEQLGLPTEFTLWIDPHDVTCRLGESLGATYYTVATFQDGLLTNYSQTLDVVEMVRSEHQRKSSELTMFQEAARRRRQQQHQQYKQLHHRNNKKSPALFLHGNKCPSGRSSPGIMSPLVTGGRYTTPPPGSLPSKDRFHWVRRNDVLAAQ